MRRRRVNLAALRRMLGEAVEPRVVVPLAPGEEPLPGELVLTLHIPRPLHARSDNTNAYPPTEEINS